MTFTGGSSRFWKRAGAAVAGVAAVSVVVVAAAGWLGDMRSDSVRGELLDASRSFELGVPDGGSMRYEYDGVMFDDKGWRGADDSLTSIRTSDDGTLTIMCDSVADGVDRTCFTKHLSRADGGYVPGKWLPFADLMLTVGGISPVGSAEHAASNPDGRWSRDGNTFTVTVDWDDASEQTSYTFAGDEVTMENTYTPDDGSPPLEFLYTWTYEAEPHLFESPAPEDVYTDAEAEVESARMETRDDSVTLDK